MGLKRYLEQTKNLTLKVLLAGLCAVTGLPACADTLSDNLSSTTYYTEVVSGNTWIAAGFATGHSSYVLKTAILLLSGPSSGQAELDLYSSSGSQPGSRLGALTSPGSYSSEPSGTTFTSADLLLSPNTSYWVVLKGLTGDFEWGYTDTNAGSGVGFQHNWGESTDVGASWFTSDIEPMQLRITADPVSAAVPEPESVQIVLGGLLCLGARVAFQLRRKSRSTYST